MSTLNAPSVTAALVLAPDQLWLTLDFFDVELNDGHLVAAGPAPVMRVGLGPQHTAEAAIAAGTTPGTDAVDSLTAGASRIVVALAPPVPFDAASLLDLARFTLVSDPTAGPPSAVSTALEVPQALLLVPSPDAHVASDQQPVSTTGVSALWTARLTGTPDVVAVEALAPGTDGFDTRTPDAAQRDDIVRQTTEAAPALARQLWLSPHGAYVDIEGDWTDAPAPRTNLVRWNHRAATGRDLHVEVTERGFLTPFGHPAAMVTVTERQFLPDVADAVVATLVQQTYLTVNGPTLESPVATPRPFMPDAGRRMPFGSVTAARTGWIPVEKRAISWTDDDGTPRSIDVDNAWHVVDAGGADLHVTFTAVDHEGNPPVTFELPVSFIEYENAFSTFSGTTPSKALADFFSSAASIGRREVDLGGADVAWAVPLVPRSGLTTKSTRRVRLRVDALDRDADGVSRADLEAVGQPNMFPAIELASVVDAQLGGSQADPLRPIDVVLHPRWLDHGNDSANVDLAYLSLVTPAQFGVGAEGRAAVAVDLTAEVFNQTTGIGTEREDAARRPGLATVGDRSRVAANGDSRAAAGDVWDPAEALGATSKALGSILLRDIISEIAFDEAVPGVDIPGVDVTLDQNMVVVTFAFEPKLRSAPAVGFIAHDDAQASVVLETRIATDGDEPSATIDVVLRDVGLQIPPSVPAVELDFSRIHVSVPAGGSTDVDVDLDGWRFEELLAWLQPLADILTGVAGPQVTVGDDALDLGFSLTPPPISMGVVEIRNFEVHAGVTLPLDGTPVSLGAGVGRPDRPVEISLVGFEGSFHLEVAFGGAPIHLQLLSVAAEASVQVYGIDVVVAEAAIHLGIGGFFRLTEAAIAFGGCIWIEGVIDVLGIVNVSVALVGSLTYKDPPKELTARGTITYSVDTILTKPKEGSVPLGKITYPLGDDDGARRAAVAVAAGDGLSFVDRFAEADWQIYTGAFA